MKIKKTLKRISYGLLAVIFFALVSGAIYEQIERKKAEKHHETKKGKFIDIGKYKLYYESIGTGGPTVVFEPGFGGDHRAWANSEIVKKISKHTTTIVYDRAGMLWSEGGSEPQNAETICSDLLNLLENGNFEKPYILVGHSAAGVYLRPFITKNNQDFLGIILLDPTHQDQIYRAPDDLKELLKAPSYPKWLLKFANATGIIRLLTGDPLIYHSIKSGGVYEARKYLTNETTTLSPETSPGNIPLTVITAAAKLDGPKEFAIIDEKMLKLKDELHTDIANSSINGKRIVSKKAAHHNIMDIESELITLEILQLIKSQNSFIVNNILSE